MTPLDYILDSALVLLVLIQIKERKLTMTSLLRPLVTVSIAVAVYLHGVPTAGNDLVLVGVLATVGAAIGVASGQTAIMRRGENGEALVRSGWASGFFWVLGMGARLAFGVWVGNGGASWLTSFSAEHSITSGEAWTVALLAMAIFEVGGRTFVLLARRHRIEDAHGRLELA